MAELISELKILIPLMSPFAKPETSQSIQSKTISHQIRLLDQVSIPIQTIDESREDLVLREALVNASVPEESQLKMLPIKFN